MTSYTAAQLRDDIDGSKAAFNLAFTEYRKGVENSYGRLQTWFPTVGNNKSKWNYDHTTLMLTIHACTRLHNWIMQERKLNYNPTTDPAYLFTAAW